MQLVLDFGKQAWGNDFIPISENRIADEYPLELYFCHNCTMVQIGYTVPKTKMFVNHAYLSGTTRSLKHHFVDVGKTILRRISFNNSDFILDIGGNDGTFLEFFKENGFHVLNVDSGTLQAKLSKEKGIRCIRKFFNKETAQEIRRAKGCAKMIHGSGILFHLEELHSAFEGIKELLALAGLLVAEFIYLPEIVKKCAYDQIYHEHLLYYDLISFQNLLDQYDLEIFDAEMKPIHGGSCVAYISHRGSYQRTPALESFYKAEIAGAFNRIDTYLQFAHKARSNKTKLVKLIKYLKLQGFSIQALGAPVKGSTIINYCKLTNQEIDCAVEVNAYKCGTLYPGTRIPVYHQDKTPSPDVYLLLAWNFKDEILRKVRGFRENGGKVIIPIPEPELI